MTHSEGNLHWLKDDFVVRWDERWRVWQSMAGSGSRFTLVVGDEGAGKTHLLCTVAEVAARHGETVVMVDLSGDPSGSDMRDLLGRIADEALKAGLSAQRLHEIASTTTSGEEGVQSFLLELAAVASGADGLLVVIDGLSGWEENVVKQNVLPLLCGPFLLDTAPGAVRLLVTMREDDPTVWPRRPQSWRPITIGTFADDEWPRAVDHLTAYWSEQVKDKTVLPRLQGLSQQLATAPYKTGNVLDFIRVFAGVPSKAGGS